MIRFRGLSGGHHRLRGEAQTELDRSLAPESSPARIRSPEDRSEAEGSGWSHG